MLLAALGGEHPPDRSQIEGIGDQGVQGIGWDGHDLAAADGGGSPLDGFRPRLLGIDYDQVSCHGYRFRDLVVKIGRT